MTPPTSQAEPGRAVELCEQRQRELRELPDAVNGIAPAWLTAMGQMDWDVERDLIHQEEYAHFLQQKSVLWQSCGFSVDTLNPMLFDFQSDITRWALKKGRAAIWADCGLGKTPMQLEWARHVHAHTAQDVLIFAPLAVSQQTVREGGKFGVPVNICRRMGDVKPGINITNYELLEHFQPERFGAVVLDESSCIKHHDSKTRNRLQEWAAVIPYRLACTATPAPNDHMELGNHAEFLGVMKRSEMLGMFFVHDGGDTGKWRLKGHAQTQFLKWLASWAVMIRKPSDLGYSDGRFLLPPIHRHQHTVGAEWTSDHLFPVEANTLRERQQARKDSLSARVKLCADLVNGSKERWLVWCNLNPESEALRKSIPGAVEVRGSDSITHKETSLMEFAAGNIRVLISKPSIAGFGMNFQTCHNIAFVGLSDSFEELYQATRRCWRFGQEHPVHVHVITGELEGAVVRNIERKELLAEEMANGLVEHMKDINAAEIHGGGREISVYEPSHTEGQGWSMRFGDCCDVIRHIPTASIGYSIYSPPFSSLYTYSNSERDMGNSRTLGEFYQHYEFLCKELYRVLKPGRLLSFHCMNMPTTLQHHGYIGLEDFRGDLIRLHQKYGFIYHSEVVIWKDPLIAATRTHAIGLAHKELVKDSAISRQGIPDYLVTMRKPDENLEPISHLPSGLERWIGDPELEPKAQRHADPSMNKRSHLIWQRYASPVWMDINPSDTLQGESVRENEDERHICPLQLQVIERGVELWSNPGDVILSTFAGIGSEGYVSLRAGRQFIGIELKRSYYEQACRNLKAAEGLKYAGTLFDEAERGGSDA